MVVADGDGAAAGADRAHRQRRARAVAGAWVDRNDSAASGGCELTGVRGFAYGEVLRVRIVESHRAGRDRERSEHRDRNVLGTAMVVGNDDRAATCPLRAHAELLARSASGSGRNGRDTRAARSKDLPGVVRFRGSERLRSGASTVKRERARIDA